MNALYLEKYLERIHFSGTPEMSMDTLEKIHQLHPAYIPFENIDPYTGRVPSLDLHDIFNKLVTELRGGYCYEQNLLLKEMLVQLGFHVELQLGRVVWRREEDSNAARSHLMLIVTVEEQKYLVDCGFGTATLTAPLQLNHEEPQQTPNGLFKISQKGGVYFLWIWKEKWLPIYRFALEKVEPADIEIPNWYLSTYPESNFKKNLVLSKVDENARYTFSNDTLNIRYEKGEKETILIKNNDELQAILKNIFGLRENAVKALRSKETN